MFNYYLYKEGFSCHPLSFYKQIVAVYSQIKSRILIFIHRWLFSFNFPDFSFVILGIFYCFRQNSEHLERPLEVALTPLPSFLLTSIKMSKSASVFKDKIVQRSRPLWFEWIKVTDSKEYIHYWKERSHRHVMVGKLYLFFFSLKPSGTSDKQNESDLPSTYIYISRPGRVRKPVCQYSHIFSKRNISEIRK